MSFDSEFKNISEWVSLGNSVSIETQYNGSCFVIANDESNMAVALVHKGDSLHSTLRRLDKGIKSYLDSGKTIDEING
jgi:hypothetical protein